MGIRLDNRLTFAPHIENLIRNCNICLHTLSKICKYIDKNTAILIYKAIIMSKLQYGLVFKMNALRQHRQKLQVVQNRALRICCLANRYVSNYTLHQRHHVLPISLRAKLDLSVLMFKVIRRSIKCNVTQSPQRMTRLNTAPVITVTRPNTAVFLRSMSYIGPNLWNNLPTAVRFMTDLDTYKKHIRQRIDSEFSALNAV